MRRAATLALVFALSLTATACGDDAPSKEGGAANNASNNGGANNGATNNATNNGATNNGAANNGAANNGATNNDAPLVLGGQILLIDGADATLPLSCALRVYDATFVDPQAPDLNAAVRQQEPIAIEASPHVWEFEALGDSFEPGLGEVYLGALCDTDGDTMFDAFGGWYGGETPVLVTEPGTTFVFTIGPLP